MHYRSLVRFYRLPSVTVAVCTLGLLAGPVCWAEGQGAPGTVAPAKESSAPLAPRGMTDVPGEPATATLEKRAEGRPSSATGSAASPSTGPTDSAESTDLGLGWVLFRTLVVLGIVLATVYLVLNFGLRRLMGLPSPARSKHALLTVIERMPLDPKRSLFVVKAAGEYLLLGAGEGSVTVLSKLDPAEVERVQSQPVAPAFAVSPFLQKLLTRRGGPPPPSA